MKNIVFDLFKFVYIFFFLLYLDTCRLDDFSIEIMMLYLFLIIFKCYLVRIIIDFLLHGLCVRTLNVYFLRVPTVFVLLL